MGQFFKNKNNFKKKKKAGDKEKGVVVVAKKKNIEENSNNNKEFEDDDEEEEKMFQQQNNNNMNKKRKAGTFEGMGLDPLILKGIKKKGYKVPTPIQRKTIPFIIEGRDIVAMARTGSGKTGAFLLPLFEKLLISRQTIGTAAKYPRALILSPTRELATQTTKFIKELGRFLKFKVVSILGGDSMDSQFSWMHDNPDIVVATPGRFMHLCVEMELKLDGVDYLVCDEADRLFEMGFGEQLNEILKRLPENRQTVLFSATLPKLLFEFTKAGLNDPMLIRLDVDSKLPETLSLNYFGCRSEDKLATLLYLLKNVINVKEQTIIFAATKHHVEYIHTVLEDLRIPNCCIYSTLDASARKISLEKFRNKKTTIMVVTDIAARGIDIPLLDNVINFHFPPKPKLFLHRVGRVARNGRNGNSYSIISPDEIAFLLDLHLFLGRPLNFDKTGKNSSEAFVGRVPQSCFDEENEVLVNLLSIKNELDTMLRTCKNGYMQYIKSRPSASAESNRRSKSLEIAKMPIHPLFGEDESENPLNDFISQVQKYRPSATIFEIGPKAGTETHKIMKYKREKDQISIEKNREIKLLSKIDSFKSKKDEENFINYLPKDHNSESGLLVASSFDKNAGDAILDLTGDDTDMLKKQRNVMKWDRKRKRFVTEDNTAKTKKIKTESGGWISASYKSDRYKVWKEKSKVDNQSESEEEAENDDGGGSKNNNNFNSSYNKRGKPIDNLRRPAFSKKLIKSGKNLLPKSKLATKGKSSQGKGEEQGKSRGKPRRELKRPEEILKARKIKEKNLAKNKPRSKKGKGKGRAKFSNKHKKN